MTEPAYKRPFSPDDFRGYFTWTKKFSKSLNADLYHACHEDELLDILDEGFLLLRSKWSIDLPEHGVCAVPGVWTGLNYFNAGNHYGPFLIKFPIEVLTGRRFMAFRRVDTDRNRYFFVQYEARIPIFSFDGNVWKSIKPNGYFSQSGKEDEYNLKRGAIYDIVLTEELPFRKAISVSATSHPHCISGKCPGMSPGKAEKRMIKIATDEFKWHLKDQGLIEKMVNKYPDMKGETVEIKLA